MKLFLFFLLWILRRASSFPQSGSKCPADSFLYLSSCFTYFNDRMGWDQAEGMCQQYGSHLLTIQNFHEASAIAALIKNYQVNENIWIRLEKPSKNNQWKITGQLKYGQQTPLKGQEDTIKHEECVELVAREGFLKWNNPHCQERRPFLCQNLPFHLGYWMKENNVTKLSKVTKSDEKSKNNQFMKFDGGIREKATTKEDKITEECLFTNNHSSEKSLTSFLMVTLVFISFLISFFP
ncbi:C-type lectin Cal-like [Sus scrofa]|uniref:C-type lectin domain-containing protein n=1 Tax=Sus scrofa TaxID=9823 RepID=A0A8D2ACH8_PIG|nr:C-type lectin Cal-like [Sus scrofa]